MHDTSDIRDKLLGFWAKYENGKLTANEARVHIGFGRAVLDSLKVEIAAAHLNSAHVPPVTLTARSQKVLPGRRAS